MHTRAHCTRISFRLNSQICMDFWHKLTKCEKDRMANRSDIATVLELGSWLNLEKRYLPTMSYFLPPRSRICDENSIQNSKDGCRHGDGVIALCSASSPLWQISEEYCKMRGGKYVWWREGGERRARGEGEGEGRGEVREGAMSKINGRSRAERFFSQVFLVAKCH